MKVIALTLIKFYQTIISPILPPLCRFVPSCSRYSFTAIERFGFLKGAFLTIRRVCKCHPFHPGGFDHVPKKHRSN